MGDIGNGTKKATIGNPKVDIKLEIKLAIRELVKVDS